MIDRKKARLNKLMIRALDHKDRQNILKLLRNENKKMTVTEILKELSMPQSTISQHLILLRRVELVEADQQGRFVYYSINEDTFAKAKDSINKFMD